MTRRSHFPHQRFLTRPETSDEYEARCGASAAQRATAARSAVRRPIPAEVRRTIRLDEASIAISCYLLRAVSDLMVWPGLIVSSMMLFGDDN